jgi:polar amino acid transport system substrate-binding protein
MVLRNKSRLAAPLALLCVAVVAGCGSSSSSQSKSVSTTPAATPSTSTPSSTPTTSSSTTPSATPTANAAVAALVPASIKSKGTINVAADASYAPDEFIGPDGHTVVGMDADLAKALAAVMGLKSNVVNATFATIIPGMAAGRYDLGMSSFTDTKAREKVVDFVDYANVGESFYTKASGGTPIGSISDICGLTVAVETGTTEQTDAATQSAKCVKEHKKPVHVEAFPNQNLGNLAVASGRAQLGFSDTPVAGYQVTKTHGMFKLVGTPYAPAPYGIAVAKSTGLTSAVKAALLVLITNGSYGSILNKWGLKGIEIPASAVKINGAIS